MIALYARAQRLFYLLISNAISRSQQDHVFDAGPMARTIQIDYDEAVTRQRCRRAIRVIRNSVLKPLPHPAASTCADEFDNSVTSFEASRLMMRHPRARRRHP